MKSAGRRLGIGDQELHVSAEHPARVHAPPCFRAATAADVEAVVALTQSAYRGDSSRVGWTTEADLLDGQRTDTRQVAELIANANVKLLLAERDGQLLACCVVERLLDAHPGDGYFGMFSVQPDAQGKGIGHTLL
ncbi:MAG: GNAT family N-acetyltransferase, partial [Rhodanobacteraceae bacterium]